MNTLPPITLIQLISEQTMQNLLPILRFRPSHVVHLSTRRTAARSNDIVKAAGQCGVTFQLEQIRLSEMPTIVETSRAVGRAIDAAHDRKHTPLVNFTRRFLALYIPPKGRTFSALRRRAAELGIVILTRTDFNKQNAFVRPGR